ncbi:hypothetical protein [Pseudomonas sp.]|uniref:hypothetical protein n=1 Tax=Pseudomonas sp. TaxID=306 RepID=UPI0026076371|nr:hypothetical protein [Pseudomonas sp.]
MYDHAQRATDHQATPNSRKDEDPTASDHDTGPTAFPVFADPPFFTWQILHRRHDVFQQVHPSVQPLILLWDEVDDSEMLS